MTTRARLMLTLEGYAVEGGFDQPGGPMTCYAPTIALGRHGAPGVADDLWQRYEEVLDLVPAVGVDGVRLSLEWARVEPRSGHLDEAALARYATVIAHANALGLAVTVVLVDAVWPSWLGPEAWLLPWVVPHLVAHARRVVDRVGEQVSGVVTFAQPAELVTDGYLRASVPPWRRGAVKDAGFARAQIAHVDEVLRADDVVGPLVIRRFTTFDLDVAPEVLTDARSQPDVEEVHLRSLLRGSGPTNAATGLLVRDGAQWRVRASDELLAALR